MSPSFGSLKVKDLSIPTLLLSQKLIRKFRRRSLVTPFPAVWLICTGLRKVKGGRLLIPYKWEWQGGLHLPIRPLDWPGRQKTLTYRFSPENWGQPWSDHPMKETSPFKKMIKLSKVVNGKRLSRWNRAARPQTWTLIH